MANSLKAGILSPTVLVAASTVQKKQVKEEAKILQEVVTY